MIIINKEAELANWVGREIGITSWLQVSQEMIQKFADATGDQQWIHTDTERASDSPFGATIAHGFLLLSLLPRCKAELIKFSFASMAINYGCDKLRFINPVKAGDAVRLRVHFEKMETVASGLKLFTHNTLEIKDENKPALIAEAITLLVR